MLTPKPEELADIPPPAYSLLPPVLNQRLPPRAPPPSPVPPPPPPTSAQRPNLPRTYASSPLPEAARSKDTRRYAFPAIPGSAFYLAVLCNLPFIIIVLIDIIATNAYPGSSAYKETILGARSRFNCITILVCIWTAASNAFIILCLCKRPRPERPRTLVLLGLVVLGLFAGAFWEHLSIAMHKAVDPVWKSCGEQGYGASVVLTMGKGTNNLTIVSAGNETEILGMELTPTLLQTLDLDRFRARAVKNMTDGGVWDAIAAAGGLEVEVRMTHHRYLVNFDRDITGGRFLDERDFFLSFPELEIRSVEKAIWSSIDEDERPQVDLIGAGSTPVLVPADGHRKSQRNLKFEKYSPMWRLCTKWNVAQILGDRGILEKVLVPLTRLSVEMDIWISEHSHTANIDGSGRSMGYAR